MKSDKNRPKWMPDAIKVYGSSGLSQKMADEKRLKWWTITWYVWVGCKATVSAPETYYVPVWRDLNIVVRPPCNAYAYRLGPVGSGAEWVQYPIPMHGCEMCYDGPQEHIMKPNTPPITKVGEAAEGMPF